MKKEDKELQGDVKPCKDFKHGLVSSPLHLKRLSCCYVENRLQVCKNGSKN